MTAEGNLRSNSQSFKAIIKPYVPWGILQMRSEIIQTTQNREPLITPQYSVRTVGEVSAIFNTRERSDFRRVKTLVGEEDFVENVLLPLMTPGTVFLDIGVCIGTHAILAAKVDPNIRVFGYEPDEDTFRRAKKTLS